MKILLVVTFAVALCGSVVLSASLRGSSHDLLAFSKGNVHESVGDIWNNCSKPDDKSRFQLIDVIVDPDPPQKGKNVTVTVEYSIRKFEVTSVHMHLQISIYVLCKQVVIKSTFKKSSV